MFPNVRLMIVAILAAIAGIGCGLGLFATFRVNHEPLARLAEGSPPLQLAVDNLALGSQTQMTLQARLPVNGAANLISVPAAIPTSSANPAADAAPSVAPNPAPAPAADRAGADSASAGDSNIQRPTEAMGVGDTANTATTVAVSTPAESSVTSVASTPSQQEPIAAAPDQQVSATGQDRTPAAAAPDQQAPATAQDRPPAAAVLDQQPAAAPAIAALSAAPAETAATKAAAEDQQPAAKPAQSVESKPPKPRVTATHAVPTRHAVKKVRVRRAAATVASQPAYQYSQPIYSQPTYTWTYGAAQASQSIKRIAIKRHRAAKKAASAAQNNPAPTTAGLGGSQY